jgi:hypothetical protein
MPASISEPKFSLGRMVATPNALDTLDPDDVQTAIIRHAAGDWGDVCQQDFRSNQSALEEGLRLFSVYRDRAGTKFWIITEGDRSATTVLLPEDY